MALTANQYTTDMAGTTSTGSLLSVNFGFDANYVRIANVGTLPLRVTFRSTTATTDDGEVIAGGVIEWRGTTYRCGVLTTSTSTDGADLRRVRVLATGG